MSWNSGKNIIYVHNCKITTLEITFLTMYTLVIMSVHDVKISADKNIHYVIDIQLYSDTSISLSFLVDEIYLF